MSPSRSVKLFGTDEPAGKLTALKVGPLEAVLDSGNLRYIKFGGTEALRAIAFLVRDRNWGTYNPEISNLKVDRQSDRFVITYNAVCKDDDQEFHYLARIEGRADGNLLFEVDGEAKTDFITNRTGFVVLHPLEGVVGQPVAVEHTDGRIVKSTFPELIDPACPFHDIRALSHQVVPGLTVTCRMQGDAFEMEDHRNWMDASYKTYVRPLALPWPYTFAKGEKSRQSVSLEFEGSAPDAASSGEGDITISVGGISDRVLPRIGLAAPAEYLDAAMERIEPLKAASAGFLVCHFDPRKSDDAETMRKHGSLGTALDADLVLEAILPCSDGEGHPTADTATLKRDVAVVRDAAEDVSFGHVAISPACDLKCTLPGSVFPPAPSWEELFSVTRDAFPSAIVGGGMFSYFTELNRKRPPAALLDFICHTGLPIVHAGDDVSFIETLEALPSIFKSVRAFGGGKPYWIFPTAICMRDNPYGQAPAENPNNVRQAMNRVDPRERGLIGAAWYAGYLARAAQAGVDAVTLGAVAGPSGIVYTRQKHPQPWFDKADAEVYPSYHVIAGHASLQGAAIHETEISHPGAVQALAISGPGGLRLWLTNLTGEAQDVRILGLGGALDVLSLDENSFEAACRDANWRKTAPREKLNGEILQLMPYATAELRNSS